MFRPTRRNLLIATGAMAATGVAAAAVTNGFGILTEEYAEYAPAPVFAENGLAIRGYDPVAYFTERRPMPGDPAYTAKWNGATWRFANAANRDTFQADPAAYAPQYGGFCAWAVAAKGKLYSTQPSNWTIHVGKLYLNYNDEIQRRWEQDIPGFIAEGNRRWPEISAGS